MVETAAVARFLIPATKRDAAVVAPGDGQQEIGSSKGSGTDNQALKVGQSFCLGSLQPLSSSECCLSCCRKTAVAETRDAIFTPMLLQAMDEGGEIAVTRR